MKIKASLKHLRMAPRKVRLIADVIRGLEVNNALAQLKFLNKKATKPIEKLVKSGVANAEHNYELDKDNLKITEIRVDEATTLKRWIPRAHGRATTIRKRGSHINLTLEEIVESGKKESKKQKIEAPIKLEAEPKDQDQGVKNENEDKDKKEDENIEKNIIDSKKQERGGHINKEGGKQKSFAGRMFRRKAG